VAAYFLDVDGTVVYQGTNKPLPGAIRGIRRLIRGGDQVLFVTQRSTDAGLREMLAEHGIKDPLIILNVESPRVIVNDQGAKAVNHRSDDPWR
jgi:ribonucleotide monophosphatase NagD (HAD superfamily)